MLRSTVPKEGMNSGEAHISCRGDIVPPGFKVVKEIQHRLGTKVRDIQLDHRPSSLCGNEPQQQDERITVALYGMRTGTTYPWEMIGEEPTEGAAKRTGARGVHRRPPSLTGV
jgi:hypothetical protein